MVETLVRPRLVGTENESTISGQSHGMELLPASHCAKDLFP